MTEMLVVQSKIKEELKKMGVNVAGDFAEALSKHVAHHLKEAAERAKANGRKTVRGYDI